MALTTPCYPPGVLQKVTIPDPTSLDGLGDLEITLIPSRGVTDINHFSNEGVQHFKEMLYQADEDFRNKKFKEMCEIQGQIQAIEARAEGIWEDNATAGRITTGRDLSRWDVKSQPSLWYQVHKYHGLPAPWDIRIALDEAEEDFDYEEWINSKQYKDSLQKYNRHKLLAWNKEKEGEHPKWSGEYKELVQSPNHTDLLNSYIKERYRVEVYVHTLCCKGGVYYSKGNTPYGDVYIPQKITEYLKDACGIYDMDIALQDVEGPSGKGPNSFPWTCVYLHNNGFALE